MSNIKSIADTLQAASESGKPCDPIADALDERTLNHAYAVQAELTRRSLAAGRTLSGRKIGLTSPAVQQQLCVDQPDYGMLFSDMEIAESSEVSLGNLIAPKAEAEIAFVLQRDIANPAVTLAELISSIAYALPALEIVDSRIADWKISIHDTVADNASSGLYVLGGSPRKLDALDLRMCGMALFDRGDIVSTGCGAACLGNPLNAALWLARTMAQTNYPLKAGDTLLSGALGPMVTVVAGANLEANISGLGKVAVRFAGDQ